MALKRVVSVWAETFLPINMGNTSTTVMRVSGAAYH